VRSCHAFTEINLARLPCLTSLTAADLPLLICDPRQAAPAALAPAPAQGVDVAAPMLEAAAVAAYVTWAAGRLPGLGALARLARLDLISCAQLRRLLAAVAQLGQVTATAAGSMTASCLRLGQRRASPR
jgi:hypothetical protein